MLLKVVGLKKYFPANRGRWDRSPGLVKAVDGISFELDAGSTLGLVGESGSGKSTLGRTILQLERATEGQVLLRGEELTRLEGDKLRLQRREMQVVFQDTYSSLSPRRTVAQSIREPLDAFAVGSGIQRDRRVFELLENVGLEPEFASRIPHELSGGQRQRVGIARAIALKPNLVIADEPVSALDMSVRSQILELMLRLQRDLGIAYLFIAHDLAVVHQVSHVVGVMYLGKIVELAENHEIFERPLHPYTRALLAAVPGVDPRRRRQQRVPLKGEPPSPASPPSGCAFRTRCPMAMPVCAVQPPLSVAPGAARSHHVACHLYT